MATSYDKHYDMNRRGKLDWSSPSFAVDGIRMHIDNRSEMPTGVLRALAKFCVRRAGIPQRLKSRGIRRVGFLFPNAKRTVGSGWCGGNIIKVNVRKAKKHTRLDWTDCRYQHAQKFVVKTRLESLAFILGHECCHVTTGRRAMFPKSKFGGHWRRAMEEHCNRFGWQCVLALRDEWPKFRRSLYAAMRGERRKAKTRELAKKTRRRTRRKAARR